MVITVVSLILIGIAFGFGFGMGVSLFSKSSDLLDKIWKYINENVFRRH